MIAHLIGVLALMLAGAKLCGWLAQRVGQPAVLGELLAGVVLGAFINTHDSTLHFLAELGVVILLFEIGLETDLRKLVEVGAASIAVATVGAALPFARCGCGAHGNERGDYRPRAVRLGATTEN